ncbi:MAG: chemotaxis protein CheX [Spirochaetota bacterium]|nr:chemotaxis protein CheX [Spirochaetota bacterium]
MEPVYINPFITSAISIVRKSAGVEVKRKNLYTVKGKNSLGGVGVILGIFGDIIGRVAYEFSRGVTIQLASRMIQKSEVHIIDKNEFRRLLKSAMSELGNLISGRAITFLHEEGYDCEISTPQIYIGKGVNLVPSIYDTFVIELETEIGDLVINLALKKSTDKLAMQKKYSRELD